MDDICPEAELSGFYYLNTLMVLPRTIAELFGMFDVRGDNG